MQSSDSQAEWTALDLESQTLIESSPSSTFMTRGNGGLTADGLTIDERSSLFNASSVSSVPTETKSDQPCSDDGTAQPQLGSSDRQYTPRLAHQSRLPPPGRIHSALASGGGVATNSFAKEVKIVNTPRPVMHQSKQSAVAATEEESLISHEPSIRGDLLRLAQAESSPPLSQRRMSMNEKTTPLSVMKQQSTDKPSAAQRSPLSALPSATVDGKRSAIPIPKSSPKDQRAYLTMSEMVRDMDKAVQSTRRDSENISHLQNRVNDKVHQMEQHLAARDKLVKTVQQISVRAAKAEQELQNLRQQLQSQQQAERDLQERLEDARRELAAVKARDKYVFGFIPKRYQWPVLLAIMLLFEFIVIVLAFEKYRSYLTGLESLLQYNTDYFASFVTNDLSEAQDKLFEAWDWLQEQVEF